MMIDYKLSLMVGIDIPIPELQLTAHIPTIKEIAFMGEKNFFTAMHYICLEKEQLMQDEKVLSNMTNFQVLMKVLEQTENKEKKAIIKTLLDILFPEYISIFTPRSINLIITNSDDNKIIMIDSDNFDILQAALKEILCVNSLFQGENIIYNPDPNSELAKTIANKLMKGRQRAAMQRGENKENNHSILVRYISILTVARIIKLEECSSLNLFQLFDLMERYSAFIEWDIDLRARLAGGKSEQQVESWMRDLHGGQQQAQAFTSDNIPSQMKVYQSGT